METYTRSNDHETPGDSEIPYLRVVKQLREQKPQGNDHEIPEDSEIEYLRLAKGARGQRKPEHNVVPPGRPYFVAHIPDPLEFEDMRKRFYDIMLKLSYKEAMAWCRGFGYSYSTYLMRRYQHRRPGLEEVIITIGWYDDGKPVNQQTRNNEAVFDKYIDYFNTSKQINNRGSPAPGPSTSLGAGHPL